MGTEAVFQHRIFDVLCAHDPKDRQAIAVLHLMDRELRRAGRLSHRSKTLQRKPTGLQQSAPHPAAETPFRVGALAPPSRHFAPASNPKLTHYPWRGHQIYS